MILCLFYIYFYTDYPCRLILNFAFLLLPEQTFNNLG